MRKIMKHADAVSRYPSLRGVFDAIDYSKLEIEPDDDDDDDDNDDPATSASKIEQFISIVSEAYPGMSRQDCIAFLLTSASGRKLALHLATITKKEEPIMDRTEQLRSIAKDFGIHRLAKCLIDDGEPHGISEFELTKLMNDEAQKSWQQGETTEGAFARYYSDPENLDLRKALQIAKSVPNFMSIEPTQVGGDDAFDTSVADSSAKAMTKLQEMAEEQRKRSPTLTVAQCFARVFEDPANAQLAAKAHRRPTPVTSYPMPR